MLQQTEVKKVIRVISSYLVEKLMNYKDITRDEAIELLMKTACYEALMNQETDLYLDSREAVWNILKEELGGNPCSVLNV